MSHAQGRKSTTVNEAKLGRPKGSAPSKAGGLAAQQRRGEARCRNSAALGDCTQALVRLTPSQGMLPDGTAGGESALCLLCISDVMHAPNYVWRQSCA